MDSGLGQAGQGRRIVLGSEPSVQKGVHCGLCSKLIQFYTIVFVTA
jgi:hypothetical protein